MSPVAVAEESEKQCSCQCDTEWPTYREDTAACVDTVQGELDTAHPWGAIIHFIFSECQLADFVTGGSTEHIPFVFLPLSGQLVYPR